MATKNLSVTRYRDNPDGTTTNYLSDGTVDTGRLEKSDDGSYNFKSINSKTSDLYNQGIKIGKQLSKKTGLAFNPTAGLPSPELPSTITPQDLARTSNLDLPSTPPALATSRARGLLGAQAQQAQNDNTIQQNLEQERAKAEANQTRSEKQVRDTMEKILSVTGERADLEERYDTAGKLEAVTEARTQVKNYNKQLIEEEAALTRQIEELEKNPGGLETSALQDLIRKTERESLRKQADISLKKLTAQAALDSANLDLDTAQSIIDSKIETQLEPLKLKLEWNQDFDNRNYSKLDKADQRLWDQVKAEDQRKYDEEKSELESAHDIWVEAAKNGAPSVVQQSILRAIGQKDYNKARELAGPYIGLMERQQEARLAGGLAGNLGTTNANEVVNLANATPEQANTSVLASILSSNKIGQGTKTQIGNVLGVLGAAQQLAANRQSGKFTGINPVRSILDAKIPFINIGIPFRQALKKPETVENEGYLEALNLMTQVWASGAALTTQQTEQVDKFTPRVTDTDSQVRTKLNNLTDFMLAQTKSRLLSEGVQFEPAKVNLFETYDLLQGASPEQLKELKAAGLIK